jgi:four helix bundle protein
MAYQSFEDLDVWKRACRLAVELIRALNGAISKSKEYALKDQMARASISVPSNIAEGYERDSRLDVIRFLRIAKGSAAELRTQCYLAMSLDFYLASSAGNSSRNAKKFRPCFKDSSVPAAVPPETLTLQPETYLKTIYG